MELVLELSNLSDTQTLAKHLSRVLEPGDIILLSGNLGTGKTAFTKALGQALGIPADKITSPSFALLHSYPDTKMPMIHVDLYRMGPDADPGAIGLDEYLDNRHLVIIEWSDYLMPGLRWTDNALRLHLDWLDQHKRRATLKAKSRNWTQRIDMIKKYMQQNP